MSEKLDAFRVMLVHLRSGRKMHLWFDEDDPRLRPDQGHFYQAIQGSMDAASVLHENLLPGRDWNIWRSDADDRYGCSIEDNDTEYASTPARAWLTAILCALITEAEG